LKLIENASVCQRERKETQISLGSKYQNDPTWANGLISAAQSVAGAVKELVRAANLAIQGQGSEEALIASARAVAAATAHLVSASRAKSDPSSPSQIALSKAAKLVAHSTSELMSAAHAASEFADDQLEDDVLDGVSVAGNKVKQLEQQSKILSLEKEIEKERRSMLGMRKAKYANARKKN